ncbi:MAG: hypothetical protein U0836_16975 [Pirellulales bacterium]
MNTALQALVEYDSVTHLSLAGAHVTEHDMRLMQSISSLQVLGLSGEGIRDSQIPFIVDMPALRVLAITDAPLSDRGIAELKRRPSIAGLELARTRVTGAGLSAFSQLEGLILDSTALSDVGLREIASLRHLRRLSLNDVRLSEALLVECVTKLPNLARLEVNGTAISDVGLEAILHHRSSGWLWIDVHNTNVTTATAQRLAQQYGVRLVYSTEWAK